MVGCGLILLVLGLWYCWVHWRGAEPSRWLLRALSAASPLGLVALEAGWFVSELGRQPWTIYRIMRTSDAVTPSSAVPLTFFVFTAVYLALAVTLIVLLSRLATRAENQRGT
jgi:cytochrome d ubiquinol oxidase subunit I